MNKVCFISDVHLNYSNVEKIILFGNFLEYLNGKIEKLFILGDLFDYWIEHSTLKLSDYYFQLSPFLKKIKYPVYFIPGNRDFDIGQDFIQFTNFNIIYKDYFLFDENNKKFLLTHGDLLCSGDYRYLIYRKFIRLNIVKKVINFFPSKLMLLFINNLRKLSRFEKKIKNRDTQNYNLDFVDKLQRKYNADYIISGHIHNYFIRKINNMILISCGHWHKSCGDYILFDGEKFEYNKYFQVSDSVGI